MNLKTLIVVGGFVVPACSGDTLSTTSARTVTLPASLAAPAKAPTTSAPADAPTTQEVSVTAVARGLPFVLSEGERWIQDKECVSCHQVPGMLWSLHAAVAADFSIAGLELDELRTWAHKELANSGTKNVHGISQLVAAGAVPPDDLIELVLASRSSAGEWEPRGQLPDQRRPLAETTEVATMWAALALVRAGVPIDRWKSSHLLVSKWLHHPSPAKSNEHTALRLLLAEALGAVERADIVAELFAQQRDDGSWAWIVGEPGDANATGLTAYALRTSQVAADDPRLARAVEFLVETQQADGSWNSPSTLRDAPDPPATGIYWGTSWAVLGLLQFVET